MRFGRLRIAWSVGCAIACVLLIVFWVRSYLWCEMVYYRPNQDQTYAFRSDEGEVSYGDWGTRASTMGSPPPVGWSYRSWWIPNGGSEVHNVIAFRKAFRGFHRTDVFGYPGCQIPDWFLVLVVGVLGLLPWFHSWKLHFSLRTLLVVTTLVAVVSGAMVFLFGE